MLDTNSKRPVFTTVEDCSKVTKDHHLLLFFPESWIDKNEGIPDIPRWILPESQQKVCWVVNKAEFYSRED